MPENSTHKCTNAVNNVQPIRNSSHMAKILSVYNSLKPGDYENGNGGKRRLSRLTQFIHATLHLSTLRKLNARKNFMFYITVTENAYCLFCATTGCYFPSKIVADFSINVLNKPFFRPMIRTVKHQTNCVLCCFIDAVLLCFGTNVFQRVKIARWSR